LIFYGLDGITHNLLIFIGVRENAPLSY